MHRQSEGVLSEGQHHVPGVHDEPFHGFGKIPREGFNAISHSGPGMLRAHKKGDPVENIITGCRPVSLLRCATAHFTADRAGETH